MAPRHLALIMLMNIVWGFNYVAAKYGVTALPPLLFTGLRFVIVLAVLAPFLRRRPQDLRQIALIGFFGGTLHFACMFTGLSLSDASVTAVLSQLHAPFSTVLSMVVLKETIGWRRGLGLGLAFGGVLFLGFDPKVLSYVEGALLVVVAAFAIAVAQVFTRQTKGIGALELQAWLALVTAPSLLFGSVLFESGQAAALGAAPWLVFAALAYTALGASVFGHSTMTFLLQRYDVALVAILSLLAPVFGVVFSLLVLGESLGPRVLIGAVITLAGVAIVAARQNKALAPATPVDAGAVLPLAAQAKSEARAP